MRIVSLACSNTEIVHALGCGHLLVGVDDHSDWPPEVVEPLPKVGPDLEIDVEKVASLEPDLVLATLTVPGHENVVAGLEEAGLPFIAPEPVSIDDVYRDIRQIAQLLGVPERGEAVVREMAAELGTGDPPTPDPHAPSVLIQWWPKPVIAPGRLSWAHQVLLRAGGRNPLGDEEVKSRPLTNREVVELAPDAIVLSWCGVHPDKYRPDVVLENPDFSGIPAIRCGQVHSVGEPFLGRPGPRLVEGIRALREVVREAARAGAGRR
ncbi:MAG: ABC transporter substrate-binding protein [Gemmatimonadales bacterium]|nr:MAG: ABC transporter substrate-binding protein [Gemmatimonadales bacterium]